MGHQPIFIAYGEPQRSVASSAFILKFIFVGIADMGGIMENEMKQILTTKRFDTTHTVEVTEDFSLPDYIPEVRRVVGVRANANVDGKYLNGDELEADGVVSYTILYMGGDGGLSAAPLDSSFSGRIPVRSAEGDVFGVEDIALSAAADNVVCRVTAPRRLTLSSKVKLRMFSQRTVDCGAGLEAESGEMPVRLKKETVPYAALKAHRANIECGGELREREGTKVISASGCLNMGEAKVVAEGIAVSGEARISLLLLTPDGVYTTAKGRSAVDMTLPCESGSLITAAAYGRCLMCEVDVAEDGLITWNMECDIDCDGVYGGEGEVSTDGYCTTCAETCTYADTATLSALRGVNGRLTVAGTKSVRSGMSVAGSFGRGTFERAEMNGGKLVLTGNATITAILCGDGEAVSEEMVLPVRYECDADGRGVENIAGKCEIGVWDCTARCDGETLSVTAELGINGVFLGERNVRTLAAITPDTEHSATRRRNVMTVCVPDGTETEWDIMKRYRVAEGAPKRSGKVYIIS